MAFLRTYITSYNGTIGYEGLEEDVREVLNNIIRNNITVDMLPTDGEAFAIEVYQMGMMSSTHFVGDDKRLFVFNGHTYSGEEVTCEKYGTRMSESGEGIAFYDNDGYLIAEYISEWNGQKVSALSILVNLLNSEEGFEEFGRLMKDVGEKVLRKIKSGNSWINGDKEELTDKIKDSLMYKVNTIIGSINSDINYIQEKIRNHKASLLSSYDRLTELMVKKEAGNNLYDTLEDKFFKELDLIAEHEKIEDILVSDGTIIIKTIPLDIYASNNSRYYGGKYCIQINISTGDIKFDSDNKRRGFWTYNDPHPHVSGRNGEACLGNLEPTIIELLHQNEYYATVLSLIDFLQSANVNDPAGNYVDNWDMYSDETGELIEESHDEDTWQCASCLNDFTYDVDSYTAHDVVELNEDDEVVDAFNEHIICPDCASDYYDYIEDIGEYANEIQYV